MAVKSVLDESVIATILTGRKRSGNEGVWHEFSNGKVVGWQSTSAQYEQQTFRRGK